MHYATSISFRMIRVAGLSLGIGAIALIGGCKVGPTYSAPRAPTPAESWHGLEGTPGVASAPVAKAPSLDGYWESFGDETLTMLVDRAIAGSPSIKIALARVAEARAIRGVSKADLWPSVDAAASAERMRSSENVNNGAMFGSDETSQFSVGVDASWEIDLFGRVRHAIDAADAEMLASEADFRDVITILTAEVATRYIELRGLQHRQAVVERTIESQQQSVQIAQARLDAGLSSELDLAQARALLESRRAQLPPILAGQRRAMHRLSVLVGEEPGALYPELSTPGPIPAMPAEVAVGLPSDAIRNRPDIRRAERQVAAATARVGVSTADLYPRVSLSGAFALVSDSTKGLTDINSRSWSIGPAVRLPLFDRRRLYRAKDAADARTQQAIGAFESTVLNAYEEVENRLVDFVREQERVALLRSATESNRRAVELSNDVYKAGIRDFLNVLDSQRALYDSEDQLVQSEITMSTNLVALYKALGGGLPKVKNDSGASSGPSEDRAEK
ncbi:MAG: efflux transporter outer membrane subunit [Phycisphaerales bacterium]|nr:MAG: efflux transporter outer membrane subunit [Phycisphaerales bacterium]